MKYKNKRRLVILGLAAAVMLTLAACGEKQPSQEEVERALEEGTLTLEDALNNGWVDQAWADAYVEENSVPAVSKTEAGAVGDFTVNTLSGEEFTKEQMSPVTFFAFVDPKDEDADTFVQALKDAYEGVKEAGADILLCTKSEDGTELFDDMPFPVVIYNDSLKETVGNGSSMIEEIPNTACWYVNGSFLSAWLSTVDAEGLIEDAGSFVQMGADMGDTSSDSSAAMVPMG